jgi:hypothetical protein
MICRVPGKLHHYLPGLFLPSVALSMLFVKPVTRMAGCAYEKCGGETRMKIVLIIWSGTP